MKMNFLHCYFCTVILVLCGCGQNNQEVEMKSNKVAENNISAKTSSTVQTAIFGAG
ncbi:MAG: hypothetical protein HY606_06990 [Planctomycetes bacterium]|nr:hypothetical protein [Planctomycetota bacterium]